MRQIQDMLSGLGVGGGRANEQATGSERGDHDTFTENRFSTFRGSNLVNGEFTELGVFVVPAQTGYVWGFGEPKSGKSDNQGRWYADPADGSGNTVGRIRLRSRNAVDKGIEDHGTRHTSELRQTLTDRRTWPFLPEANMPIVGEDSKMYVEFEYDSAASTGSSITTADSTFRIAVTEFTNM